MPQLGKPHDLLDLLKLAYHSTGGGSVGDDSPFAKLWGLMEGLMRADMEEVQLPAPFKKLPLLLREDALNHLRREVRCPPSATSKLHPVTTSKLSGRFKLQLEGAAQITLHLDARSQARPLDLSIRRDRSGWTLYSPHIAAFPRGYLSCIATSLDPLADPLLFACVLPPFLLHWRARRSRDTTRASISHTSLSSACRALLMPRALTSRRLARSHAACAHAEALRSIGTFRSLEGMRSSSSRRTRNATVQSRAGRAPPAAGTT